MIEMVKAIISDLDGTILPCGGEISKEALHAFGMLGERKIVRIIATGRTLFAARRFLPDDFPIVFWYFPPERVLCTGRIKRSFWPGICQS